MKLTLSVNLEGIAMLTAKDVRQAICIAIAKNDADTFTHGESHAISDIYGKALGKWQVVEDAGPSQGDTLADGSVIAVVVSPQDVQIVAEDTFGRDITIDQAREYLETHATKVSDAMVHGWDEVLGNLESLEKFAVANGTPVEDVDGGAHDPRNDRA